MYKSAHILDEVYRKTARTRQNIQLHHNSLQTAALVIIKFYQRLRPTFIYILVCWSASL